MDTIIYKEKQTTYPIFYFILAAELPLILFIIILSLKQKAYEAMVIITLLFGFLVFILANFFHLKIKLFQNKIIFNFGIFSKIIYFSDIKSVELQDYSFWKYWGWGIRWSPFDNSRAWVTRSGQGVLISTSLRKYFLSAHKPNKLKELITKYIK